MWSMTGNALGRHAERGPILPVLTFDGTAIACWPFPPGTNLHQDRIHPVVQSGAPGDEQRQRATATEPRYGTRECRSP